MSIPEYVHGDRPRRQHTARGAAGIGALCLGGRSGGRRGAVVAQGRGGVTCWELSSKTPVMARAGRGNVGRWFGPVGIGRSGADRDGFLRTLHRVISLVRK
jgi:hypothetical protein